MKRLNWLILQGFFYNFWNFSYHTFRPTTAKLANLVTIKQWWIVDKAILRRHFETGTKKVFGEPHELSDTEPKSLEYQLSDYRSSPENQRFPTNNRRYEQGKLLKDKNMYRSTPEIHNRSLSRDRNGSYHDSLPREEALDKSRSQRFRSEIFLNREESDRRTDRFVDSGIENDFRRDSSENYRPVRPLRTHPDLYNESEDEGKSKSELPVFNSDLAHFNGIYF